MTDSASIPATDEEPGNPDLGGHCIPHPDGSVRRREFHQEEPNLYQYQFSLDGIAGRVYDDIEDQLFRRYLDQCTLTSCRWLANASQTRELPLPKSGYWKKP